MNGGAAAAAPGPLKAWLLAARPATLWAAVAPVVVGTACAYSAGSMRWRGAVACLVGALLLQLCSNFSNDLADFDKGADTEQRLGPRRAVASGWISRRQMLLAAVATSVLAVLVGLYLLYLAGPLMLPVWGASLLSAWAYTAGPYPLAYLGLGDIFVFVFFGLVAVVGTAYVQIGGFTELAWLAAVPVGALATAILVVNNLRDRAEDRRSGKKTLAVRWGAVAARGEYRLLLAVSFVVPLWIAVRLQSPWPLAPWLVAPLAWRRLADIGRLDGRELNPLLGRTARLLLAFSALLSGGIALA